jgi:hypothetical protein
MKKIYNCLGGMLVFFCLLGSCSMGGDKPKNFLETEETTKKEDETSSDNETLSEEENPDETQNETPDDPEEIPPPVDFIICKALPENEIVFEFSDSVSLVSLSFDPELRYEVIEKEGSEIKIKLTENTDPGLSVDADLQVKDEHDNNISEQISFRTKNNRVPRLQINELRTEYSKPKAEFIELKMLSAGNMGALRVFVASNKAPMIYEFAPIEVKEGEYVVLHLRTFENSCNDEYGEGLSPTARDLWIPGSNELLRKTDAVYVLDQDDKVLDAVMISENSSSVWSNKGIAAAAEFLFDQGFWKSPAGKVCTPAEAVDTSVYKTAATLSISRKDAPNTHTAADWYITTSGGVSPGLPNKP